MASICLPPVGREPVMLRPQAVMVQVSARLLKSALLETDERSKLEGELVSDIEVVKCSTWEVRWQLL